MYLIKYCRKNNEIYYNIITYLETYHYVGNTTNNGWKVLGVYILHDKRFIPLKTYKTMLRESKYKSHKRSKFKRIISILLERK